MAPVVDLSTPESDQLVPPVVDLSTPEPDQLVAALFVSARALAMSQLRPLGLQLLTPSLHRYLLGRRPHPKHNLITVGMAYHCISHPESPYRQKRYYVAQKLLLEDVMAGFARFFGLKVESLYFWLYGRAIKPDETVSDVCYIYLLNKSHVLTLPLRSSCHLASLPPPTTSCFEIMVVARNSSSALSSADFSLNYQVTIVDRHIGS
jgi:hypothetical protein